MIRQAGFDVVQVGETESVEDVEAQVRAAETEPAKTPAGRRSALSRCRWSSTAWRAISAWLSFPRPVRDAVAATDGAVCRRLAVLRRRLQEPPRPAARTWMCWSRSVPPSPISTASAVTFGLVPSANVYFETGAAIITLIMLGKFLESRAKGQTSAALKALMGLRAKTAHVVRDGVETEIDIEQVVGRRYADRAAGRKGPGRRHHQRRALDL